MEAHSILPAGQKLVKPTMATKDNDDDEEDEE